MKAPAPKRHFPFIGGHPAVDLLNTQVMRGGVERDLLDGPEALRQWLKKAGVADRVDAASLRAVRAIRAALRRIAIDVTDGRSPKARDLRSINRELKRGLGNLTLQQTRGELSFTFRTSRTDARFAVARMVGEFLAHLEPHRLRACGGARCILFFYDTSKSGTRRWCAMSGCGNRAKAAGHFRRQKADGRRQK